MRNDEFCGKFNVKFNLPHSYFNKHIPSFLFVPKKKEEELAICFLLFRTNKRGWDKEEEVECFEFLLTLDICNK